MVERFHRQLKTALKAQLNPDSLMEALPLVLLGIRTALKEDISSTAAEMVYGKTLRIPGEFFTSSPTISLPDPSDYVSQFKTHMKSIRPSPPCPTQRNSHIIDGLSTATHVFIRQDAICKPLQPPYDGPFPVVKRTDNHFTTDINGRQDTIFVDRLKPAYLDTDHPPPIQQTALPTTIQTTRSRRHVHFPQYLASYMS